MSRPQVIMIAGAAGTGKDTVAKMIRWRRSDAHRWALAEPIKQFAQKVFGFSERQLYGPSADREEPDPAFTAWRWPSNETWRWAAQNYSQERILFATHMSVWTNVPFTEILRSLDEWWRSIVTRQEPLTPRVVLQTLGSDCGRNLDPFVWIRALEHRAALSDAPLALVTDGRFDNEFEYARQRNWALWHVERATVTSDPDAHPSERDMFSAVLPKLRSHHLINNGSLDELRAQVMTCLSEVTGDPS